MDFFAQRKPIVFAVIGILVLGGLIGAIFYFDLLSVFLAGSGTGAKPQTTTGDVGRLPNTQARPDGATPPASPGSENTNPSVPRAQDQLIRITDFSVLAPAAHNSKPGVAFYKKAGGDVYTSDTDGQRVEKISNLTIVGMINSIWSPVRDRAVVFYLDGETVKAFVHTSDSGISVLPSGISSLSWSPDGKEFAYLIPAPNGATVYKADSEGSKQTKLFDTPMQKAEISWITPDEISVMPLPSYLAEGYLFVHSLSKKTHRQVAGPLYGLTAKWSPGGTRVLIGFSEQNGKEPKLAIFSAAGTRLFELALQTLPDKCVWKSETDLFCAVPRAVAPISIWPDDFRMGTLQSNDRMLSINLETRASTEIFNDENNSFGAISLVFSGNDNALYFVNQFDGSLNRLRLP